MEALLSPEEYEQALPRKRVAAGVLFFDPEGRVLLVDPVYKDLWEIPGGAVEENESPRAGAVREIKEELGLEWEPGRLLGVDWRGPRPGRSEGLAYVFDGGVLSGDRLARVRLQPEELGGWSLSLSAGSGSAWWSGWRCGWRRVCGRASMV